MTATLISSLLARFVDEEGLTASSGSRAINTTTGDIISQGAAPRAVCLLSHSTVEILLETAVRAAMLSDTLQVVGEMAYLTGANAGTTVR